MLLSRSQGELGRKIKAEYCNNRYVMPLGKAERDARALRGQREPTSTRLK
jgi:hypothetical protein